MNKSIKDSIFKNNFVVIAIIIVVKLLIVYWYTDVLYSFNAAQCIKHFVFIGGDARSYLDPYTNFISSGKFYFINEKSDQIFIGRGPYYGLPYFLFRFILDEKNSYVALGFLQIILDFISTFLLYKLICKYAKNEKIFPIILLFVLTVIPTATLTLHLITESVSISLSVISLWFFIKYRENNNNKYFWISAFLFCWMITLKPYLLPMGGVLFLFYFLNDRKNSIYWSKKLLLFYLPLVIIVTPYTIRNWVNYKQFVPFQDKYAGYGYTEADLAIRHFIQAFGGSIVFWDQNSAASFFIQSQGIGTVFHFPDYAFASGYNLDSLKVIASEYKIVNSKNPPDKLLVADIAAKMNRYTDCFQREKPFVFYIKSRYDLAMRFIFKNGSYFLPRKTYFQLAVKISQALLYFMMLGSLFICTVLVFYKFKSIPVIVKYAVSSCWFPVFVFPLFLKSDEWRYLDTAYPFLIFLTGYLILKITKSLNADLNPKQNPIMIDKLTEG